MGTRSRTDRAAGAIIAFEGLFLLVLAAGTLARALPDLGSADPHVAGDAGMAVFIGGFPIGVAGLLTLFLALRLWRERPGAKVFAAALAAVAGLYSATMLTGFGNVLWAVRIIVFEPAAWLVRWPYLYWNPFLGTNVSGTPVESYPYGRLDDVAFWFPGIVAVGALLVACFLLAGWIAGRARGARSD